MLQICRNIRLARESKNISQSKMADLLDVSRTTYRNWEEETEPTLAIIRSIADVLEIPAHTLLEGIIDFASVNHVNDPGREYKSKPAPGEMPADLLTVLKNEMATMQASLDKLARAAGVQASLSNTEDPRAKEDLSLDKKRRGLK